MEFSETTLDDYVSSHGLGPMTQEGLKLGETLFLLGDDYTTIAHEIVFSGLTDNTRADR